MAKKIIIKCNIKTINCLRRIGALKKEDGASSISTDISPHLLENVYQIKAKEDIFTLVPQITEEAPVEMDNKLKSIFISKVGEMYNNAMEHCESHYIVGGKYYCHQKDLYSFVMMLA